MRARAAIWKVMPRITLDGDTADRMLSGYVDPLDVPPGYERVSALLHVLGGDGADRSIDSTTPTRESRSMRVTAPARLRLSGVAIVAACCLGTCTAAYAAGLPQSASDTASAILAKLGVHSHATPSHPTNHGAVVSAVARDRTASGKAHGAAVSAVASTTGQAHRHTSGDASDSHGDPGHGTAGKDSEISQLATSTAASGADEGTTISSAASGGQSQAGQHSGGSGDSLGDSANARTLHSAHSDRQQGGSGTTAR